MKLFKTTITLIAFLLCYSFVSAANIDNINVTSETQIEFDLDSGSTLSGAISTQDVKLYKDVKISLASKDIADDTKVILDLGSELQINTQYSLLNIEGPQGNLDFQTGDVINNLDLLNDVSTGQYITRAVLKDSKTIELYYNNAIADGNLEFKLLSEVGIKSILGTENKVIVELNQRLEEYSSYMVMILSMKDISGVELVFEEDLYDFFTESFITTQAIQASTNENGITADSLEDDNVSEVAMNAPEIPETGADTAVLILLALGLNAFLLFRKKIFKA